MGGGGYYMYFPMQCNVFPNLKAVRSHPPQWTLALTCCHGEGTLNLTYNTRTARGQGADAASHKITGGQRVGWVTRAATAVQGQDSHQKVKLIEQTLNLGLMRLQLGQKYASYHNIDLVFSFLGETFGLLGYRGRLEAEQGFSYYK